MSSTFWVLAPSGGTTLQCSKSKIFFFLCRKEQQNKALECKGSFSHYLTSGRDTYNPSYTPLLKPLYPYFLCDPIMTFETKLTMALAGCSGSCSANRWHTFSVSRWDFLAINPKILEEKERDTTIHLHNSRETFHLPEQRHEKDAVIPTKVLQGSSSGSACSHYSGSWGHCHCVHSAWTQYFVTFFAAFFMILPIRTWHSGNDSIPPISI